jgi:hypothetical protein
MNWTLHRGDCRDSRRGVTLWQRLTGSRRCSIRKPVDDGGRVTSWNRNGERIDREHFGGLVASMAGQQVSDEWKAWAYWNVAYQMRHAWYACGGEP